MNSSLVRKMPPILLAVFESHDDCQSLMPRMCVSIFMAGDFQTLVPLGRRQSNFKLRLSHAALKKAVILSIWMTEHIKSLVSRKRLFHPSFGRTSLTLIKMPDVSKPWQPELWAFQACTTRQEEWDAWVVLNFSGWWCVPLLKLATCCWIFCMHLFIGLFF